MADDELKIPEFPDGVQKLFDERHERSIRDSFRAARQKITHYAFIIGGILLLLIYLLLPVSRVRNISVHGNDYLSRSYVETAADISERSVFFLQIPLLIEHRLENEPLIHKADMKLYSGNMIGIDIEEERVIGYRYVDEPVLLLADGQQTPLKSEYLNIIARVPLISGFETEEQTRMLVKAFANVEPAMIEQMAEVSQYDMGYDSQTIRVLMRTGGYYISGYNSLEYINTYDEVYSRINDKSQCIIVEDGFKAAYTKTCPWNEPVREVEYWLDSDGNKIINTTGIPAEKHYYGLSDGAMAHDAEGNQILIPINGRGDDDPDPDFEEHYYAGYYETGKLVIPEEEPEPEPDEQPETQEEPEPEADEAG